MVISTYAPKFTKQNFVLFREYKDFHHGLVTKGPLFLDFATHNIKLAKERMGAMAESLSPQAGSRGANRILLFNHGGS
ncbi:MAG: hypothetical protein LAO76_24080 [Acidobacteriia bacterium]|nr:hypothetical protein [Terriglobia bacterium]